MSRPLLTDGRIIAGMLRPSTQRRSAYTKLEIIPSPAGPWARLTL